MGLIELWRQSCGIVPELVIVATICAVIVVDMRTSLARTGRRAGLLALTGILIALAVAVNRLDKGNSAYILYTFDGMLQYDQLSAFFRILFLVGAGVTVLFSMRSRETAGYRQGEYYSLILGALLGAMFLAAANNTVMFMISFETLSISCYVLASFIKHERPSAEAGLKYMIYGAVTSGIMLFGFSYLYGLSGTLSISGAMRSVASQVGAGELSGLAVFVTLAFLLAGIGFKMAMVPFHFWCPDVYQGAPTPITAFLAVVSKAAGFSALLRLMLPFFTLEGHGTEWLTGVGLPVFFGVLSVVTMTYGNLVALRQTDVKRLLAYSSIAHAGYLLMAMTVYQHASMEAILFYLFIYLFMTLGAFWVVIVLVNRLGSAQISRFRGVAYSAPFLFATMFIFLISLTGLPPTAGFVGKFILFKVVISAGVSHMADGAMTPLAGFYFVVALAGLFNSVVSLYYYMNIAKTMVFEKPLDDVALGEGSVDRIYAALLAAPVLVLLYFTPVLHFIKLAAH